MSFSDWLLALHILSAFALVGALVVFWFLIVAGRNADTPAATLAMGRPAQVGATSVALGSIGTLVFGIWLAIDPSTASQSGAGGSSSLSCSGRSA